MTRTLALVVIAACGGSGDAHYPPAQIVDLSTSAAELQRDFDAHSGEARFVTLLSPT